jgi:hypothetical protein
VGTAAKESEKGHAYGGGPCPCSEKATEKKEATEKKGHGHPCPCPSAPHLVQRQALTGS